MSITEEAAQRFREAFGREPEFVVRAPGRVNLIGEHTDYNDGFVLPMALGLETSVAGAMRRDGCVRCYSSSFSELAEIDVAGKKAEPGQGWAGYLAGVAAILRQNRRLWGFDGFVTSSVPIGSGLSSSAALTTAASLAFEAASGFQLAAPERAAACQRAEGVFAGVQCGIMDPFVSSAAEVGHALLLDTRSLETRQVPIPEGIVVIVADSRKRRGLAGSAYNQRRAECESAASALGVSSLRDANLDLLHDSFGRIGSAELRRARHVVTENKRVLQAVQALEAGDVRAMGRLMDASHDSLRDDYEVSCKELDALTEAARGVEGCFGSRMTGAGFGGCTVSLVAPEAVERFQRKVAERYELATGLSPVFYVCRAAEGASRIR